MTVTHEETFETTVAHFVRFAEPELDLEDVCLEVLAGQAEVSRAIARRVLHATALDPSAKPLAEAKREADRLALANLAFLTGDPAALPYLDRAFTLLLCRDALGAAADPAAVVRELVRVSRPGAGIVVSDSTLSADELTALLEDAGAEVRRAETVDSHAYVAASAP